MVHQFLEDLDPNGNFNFCLYRKIEKKGIILGVTMGMIQVVNVQFQWFIVFILHQMVMVFFGIVLMLVQLIFLSFQLNMIFNNHLFRTPWIIIGSHRPMYTSEIDHPDLLVSAQLQLHLEPLFYKYKVDVNLFAHLHAYERSCSMYQQKCVDDGITNALIGMAGIALDSRPYSTTDWSQYHDQQYGYTIISANKTYLHFRYYHTSDNNIADQFILQK